MNVPALQHIYAFRCKIISDIKILGILEQKCESVIKHNKGSETMYLSYKTDLILAITNTIYDLI